MYTVLLVIEDYTNSIMLYKHSDYIRLMTIFSDYIRLMTAFYYYKTGLSLYN